MDNPCKICTLSASEKAACCGCRDRLMWESKMVKDRLADRLKSENAKEAVRTADKVSNLILFYKRVRRNGDRMMSSVTE